MNILTAMFPIPPCRAECALLGGTLGSIHSAEENAFIYSLLRPAR